MAFGSKILARINRRRAEHLEHEVHCTALCCAGSGQRASIMHMTGSVQEAESLRDLGVREGAVVTVVRDGDPLVVRVDDARFGIGRAAAMNVLCEFID